jgi:hypothetical protein
MTRRTTSRRLAVLLGLALAVAACGSSSSTASPSASGAPATAAAPSGAGSGGAAASGDATLGITIGTPYTLTDVPSALSATLQAAIEKDMGGISKVVHVGVKTVQQGTKVAAYLMVVAFPPGTLTDSIYAQAITNLSMGSESSFESQVISNVRVDTGLMGGANVGVFRTGDALLITMSPTGGDVLPVVKALIAANG